MSLHYREALEKLRHLTKQTDWYTEFNALAIALQENLDGEMLFGATEQSRRNRYELVYKLDQLTKAHQINIPFSDLSRDPTQNVHEQAAEALTTVSQEKPMIIRVTPQRLGTSEKWAVIVGINQYQDTLSYGHLKVCVHDATSLFKTLSTDGFKGEHMRLLTDQTTPLRPLREHILTTLQMIANATNLDDLLLFYFSGHGLVEGNESYLIPSNGTATINHTSIALNDIKKIMIKAQAKAKVIILDACHSGATIQAKGKQFMSEEFINNVFRDAEGLAIISSCQQGQLSYEWPEKQRSVFTYYLLEALQGKADYENKGFVTVADVNRYITHGVKEWALQQNLNQLPRLDNLVTGEIVLLEYSQPDSATQPQAPAENELSKRNKAANILDPYVGSLENLHEGRVHQELEKQLTREEGIKFREKPASFKEDVLARYHAIPLHAILLYTSEDQTIAAYLSKYMAELDALTDDVCDIHPIIDQFKQPQEANAYTFMRELDVLRNAHFNAYEQLPVLFFWDKQNSSEYISFGNNLDITSISHTLRLVFGALRLEPTIASVTQIKERLQRDKKQVISAQLPKQRKSNVVKTPNTSDQRNKLYPNINNHTNDLDLHEIRLTFSICKSNIDSIIKNLKPTNRTSRESIGVPNLNNFIDEVNYIINTFDPFVNNPSSVSAADFEYVEKANLSTSTIYNHSVDLMIRLTVAKTLLEKISKIEYTQFSFDAELKIRYYKLLQECYSLALIIFNLSPPD